MLWDSVCGWVGVEDEVSRKAEIKSGAKVVLGGGGGSWCVGNER